MSETPPRQSLAARALPWAILTLIGIGVGGVLYVMTAASFKPADEGLRQFRRGSLHRLEVFDASRPGPTATVMDAQGGAVVLADRAAPLTLVNLWATWCAPCRTEMPTLAAAERAYGAWGLRVVAVSLDRPQEQADARRFMAGQAPLAFYAEPTMAIFNGLTPRAMGLPVTLLLDARGREIARVVGDADWTSPEARGLIEAVLPPSGAAGTLPAPRPPG